MQKINFESDTSKRLLLLVGVGVLWSLALVTKVVCLLSLLQPQMWTLEANMIRWVGFAFYVVVLIVALCGTLAIWPRQAAESDFPVRSPQSQQTFKSYLLTPPLLAGVVMTLLLGRLDVALILNYGSSLINAFRRFRSDYEKEKPVLRRFKRLDSCFAVPSFLLLILALSFNSLSIVILLLAVDLASMGVCLPALLKMAP